MEILNSIKKLTLMKKSKCCNAEVGKVYDTKFTYYKCVHCGQECELMEKSERENINNIVRNFTETLDDLHNRGLLDVFRAQNKELIEKLNYLITQEKQERDITKSESAASDSTEIHHKVFEALGEVSMCWNPMPSSQVFESGKAQEIGNRLVADIYNYASQKDAQIQALTKEVEELKGHIEHLESQIFTLESTEADQISQFKISGNKMAEALNMFIGPNNMSFDSCELLAKKSLELWERLNK